MLRHLLLHTAAARTPQLRGLRSGALIPTVARNIASGRSRHPQAIAASGRSPHAGGRGRATHSRDGGSGGGGSGASRSKKQQKRGHEKDEKALEWKYPASASLGGDEERDTGGSSMSSMSDAVFQVGFGGKR